MSPVCYEEELALNQSDSVVRSALIFNNEHSNKKIVKGLLFNKARMFLQSNENLY